MYVNCWIRQCTSFAGYRWYRKFTPAEAIWIYSQRILPSSRCLSACECWSELVQHIIIGNIIQSCEASEQYYRKSTHTGINDVTTVRLLSRFYASPCFLLAAARTKWCSGLSRLYRNSGDLSRLRTENIHLRNRKSDLNMYKTKLRGDVYISFVSAATSS